MVGQVDVEVVRLRRFDDGESKLKAFVDVAIGDFIVKGLRVVQGGKGLFLAMPQEKGKDGRWYDSFYAKGPEARQALTEIVLAAYQQ
ncbi:MAG: SpoVG family protein [Candidatus Omnitrophota bacterium]